MLQRHLAAITVIDRDERTSPTTLPVYYSPTYTAAAVDFDTTRKSSWVAESLVTQPMDGVSLIKPPMLTRDQLVAVHDAT